MLKEAIEKAGYVGKVKIGMDVAAAEFYLSESKSYDLDFKTENNDGSQVKTGAELLEVYKAFCNEYPVISIEDPFDQVRHTCNVCTPPNAGHDAGPPHPASLRTTSTRTRR